MSGIYIHIPFCKQACHYCDFHFSTSVQKKEAMVSALRKEIELRRSEIAADTLIETIYFGGGTPSLLSVTELQSIIDTIQQQYRMADTVEITVEANPDDLTTTKIKELAQSDVNRLSIGVQSFFEKDLLLMNRAHTATEATKCIEMARSYFDNISIDLIYGIPDMTMEQWKENLAIALALDVPHISSYALTVEPRTALASFIEKELIKPVDDAVAEQHFEILLATMERHHFEHYEFSNFGKKGYLSRNNTAYWQGKHYLGIGPSAHSYNGVTRSWNINNNTLYLAAIQKNEIPREVETLSTTDKYNEYVMTGLRTKWGVSLQKIAHSFGKTFETYARQQAQKHLDEDLLVLEGDILKVSKKGKFLSDGIASDLFLLNLK